MSYGGSGGHSMWFASVVRALCNQHLNRLEMTTLGRLRLPVPGGRFYVMPDQVGRDAGRYLRVEPGHIHRDPEYATAW